MREPSYGYNAVHGELWRAQLLAFAVLAVLGLAAAWGTLIPGVSHWGDVVAGAIDSLRLTGPVAAAFAAWAASRRRSGGEGPAGVSDLAGALLVLLVVLGAYAVSVGALMVKTALDNDWGSVAVEGLLVGALGLAAHVALGWTAGWLIPGPITAFAVGVAAYLLASWLAGAGGWISRLVPLARQPYDPYTRWEPIVLHHQALWLIGCTLTVLLAWAVAATRRAGLLAPLALAALAAAGGAALLYEGRETPQVALDQVPNTCHRWPVTVCVHPSMRDGLPDLDARFTDLAARLSGTPASFSRVEQYPRGKAVPPTPGVAAIHLDDLAPGFAEKAVADFVDRLTPQNCPAGPQDIVSAWLRGDPLPRGPLHQATTWFSRLDEYPRRAWLRAHYAEFTGCRLTAGDFTDAAIPQPAVTSGSLTSWPIREPAATSGTS